MVGTRVLNGAVCGADGLIGSVGGWRWTDVDGFWLDEAEADAVTADLTGPGDLVGPDGGSGEGVGGVGEEEALSTVRVARGGKHRQLRYSSTWLAGTYVILRVGRHGDKMKHKCEFPVSDQKNKK